MGQSRRPDPRVGWLCHLAPRAGTSAVVRDGRVQVFRSTERVLRWMAARSTQRARHRVSRNSGSAHCCRPSGCATTLYIVPLVAGHLVVAAIYRLVWISTASRTVASGIALVSAAMGAGVGTLTWAGQFQFVGSVANGSALRRPFSWPLARGGRRGRHAGRAAPGRGSSRCQTMRRHSPPGRSTASESRERRPHSSSPGL
jgi:hypothetical protein